MNYDVKSVKKWSRLNSSVNNIICVLFIDTDIDNLLIILNTKIYWITKNIGEWLNGVFTLWKICDYSM